MQENDIPLIRRYQQNAIIRKEHHIRNLFIIFQDISANNSKVLIINKDNNIIPRRTGNHIEINRKAHDLNPKSIKHILNCSQNALVATAFMFGFSFVKVVQVFVALVKGIRAFNWLFVYRKILGLQIGVFVFCRGFLLLF